ncbi:hypothetical protein [Methylobacterium nonmethylotrophicum]|uniref:Uncharacterized protein n=1 Tax=Methylobacterium nonmethylotrophicum TaxID=1141884 RepID=A0A4Z0NWM9_9HYPH|nr:hypothetical protein [Methylobacterium nonmethylotrophicum]TGE01878.1 hypothetical protein EU555_04195 [Methylobacterium nonmethylotrophicum]
MHRAISVALLLVATSLGPAGAEELLLSVKAPTPDPAPDAAPPAVNLGGGFIEFLITGRVPQPRSDVAPMPTAAPGQAAQVPAVPMQGAQVPAHVPAQMPIAPARTVQAQAATGPAMPTGDVTVVDYSGPFEPGSVILNVTKNLVYRILPDGKMAIYRNDSSQIRLARSMLKQAGR